MALLPPAPPIPRNLQQQQTAYANASFWSDWYEQLRTLVNTTITSVDWSIITGKPTTLGGYGITDAAPLSHVGSGGAAHANVVAGGAAGFMTGADKTKLDSLTDNVVSGGYTPTLTNVANLDGSTAYQCQYMRVGNVVTVSGKVSLDPTTVDTTTQLGISLPVASNFGAAEDCAGVAFATGIAGWNAQQGAAIFGDATNNRAQLEYLAGDTTNQPMYFTFTYEVI